MKRIPLIENERAFLASLDMKEGPYEKGGGLRLVGDSAVTLAGGAAGGAGAYAGWVASLTAWEKFLFILGWTSPPVGIILGAATACGVGVLACRKLAGATKQKVDQALYHKVPKSICCDPEDLARNMVEVAVAFAEQEGVLTENSSREKRRLKPGLKKAGHGPLADSGTQPEGGGARPPFSHPRGKALRKSSL